jgi:hypothetical protein
MLKIVKKKDNLGDLEEDGKVTWKDLKVGREDVAWIQLAQHSPVAGCSEPSGSIKGG